MPHRHGRDLRKNRFSEPFRPYLITTVTRNRHPLFRDLTAGRLLIQTLRAATPHTQTLAFVVMPDHLHWLMVLGNTQSLERVVGDVKRISSLKIARWRGQPGGIWQSGFYDHALREEEDVRQAARYVVANPLRAGLTDRLEDYPVWDAEWM